jgi:hypothetical protein
MAKLLLRGPVGVFPVALSPGGWWRDARRIRIPAVKSTVGEALGALQPGAGVVLAEGHHGAWFDGTRGVSIYLPVVARISPWYPTLAFANGTQWDEMLLAYRQQF